MQGRSPSHEIRLVILHSQFQLVLDKCKISASLLDKLLMSALFYDMPMIQHDDVISIFYRTQTMCCNNDSPASVELTQVFYDYSFIVWCSPELYQKSFLTFILVGEKSLLICGK